MSKDEQQRLREEDLFQPVRNFLVAQGYQVYGEVKDCDIVAVKDQDMIAVELKRHLSVKLLLQAAKRQKTADSVYIAIPKPKRLKYAHQKDISHLLRRLELGLIYVVTGRQPYRTEIVVHPAAFDRLKSRNRNKQKRYAIIEEIKGRCLDLNKGGSTGKPLVTAYRQSAIQIAYYLQQFGPLTPKKLRDLGTDQKKTRRILADNYYGWFRRVEYGVYAITETGKAALPAYQPLVEQYTKTINNKTNNLK